MTPHPTATQEKALQINREATRYGTFVEIGAGQEVVRWFFHVGGAAGTVAKTMSAYDMAVSDAIYGRCPRYVSRQRLQAMLDHEWRLLLRRLDRARGARTRFFVFADTVATRSFTRREDGRGWLGVRFQASPRAKPSEVVIHARMWDADNARQQEALGILGVNLLHGAFHLHARPDRMIGALMDSLTRDRLEVDLIKCSGPAFAGVDARLLSLQLVHQRLTNAAFFTAKGEVVEPAEVLHQQSVLIERGSFRPVTNVTQDIIRRARAKLGADREPVVLMEMTLRHLLGTQPSIDHEDFLARADTLGLLGHTVMISNYSRFYSVASYLRRYTSKPVAMVLGVPTLAALLEGKHYVDLEGGLLEAMGRLFQGSVRLLVYPWKNPSTEELVTATTFRPPPHLRHFYAHLLGNGFVVPITDYDRTSLDILPTDVLRRIQGGKAGWEKMVPRPVVARIKRDRLFGWRSRSR